MASPVCQPNSLILIACSPWCEGDFRIENGLHYRRDASMGEDHVQLRLGQAPHLLALLNNTVWGLLARNGATNLAHARREFSYQLDTALHDLAS
jgi:hypothetical protein